MCLIAYQPPGDKAFERSVLENGWDQNHHGAGYMFAEEGKLVIRKPFFKLKELLRSYHADHRRCGEASHFVVHFRWATHGSAKAVNIHPHELAGGDAGLVHNGVLSDFIPHMRNDLSDTAWFCKTVLLGRSIKQLTNVEFGNVLAEMIGERNKFVILDKTGACIIVNDTSGVYDGTRWYSNSDYEKKAWSGWQKTTGGIAVHDPNYKPGSCSGPFFPGSNDTHGPNLTETEIDPRLPAVYQRQSIADPPDPTGDIPAEVMAGLSDVQLDELHELYAEEYDTLYTEAREDGGWADIDWDLMDREAWIEARRQFDEIHAEEAYNAKLAAELDAEIDSRKAKFTPERRRVLPPAELRDETEKWPAESQADFGPMN